MFGSRSGRWIGATGSRGRSGSDVRALLIALLLIVTAAHAQAFRITDPWPDPAALGATRTEHVTFQSKDAFVPNDSADAPARAVSGTLYLPADASPAHPVPAVVFLLGAAGLVAQRGDLYGPQLAAMGVASLVVDTYGSRRDIATSFIGRALNITETMFVADAYGALRYLAGRGDIDAKSVVLAGWSYGGMATMYALYATMAERLAPPGLRFAGHVSYYGPCIATFADHRTTGAPLLMLMGADDLLTRADRCAKIADEMRQGGSEVTVIAYAGAVHQWDGALPRRMIGRQLQDCRFRVQRNGTVRDQDTLLPMTGPLTRKIILALCVRNQPYPIGRDDAVRALSNRDFGTFLSRVFTSPAVQQHAAAGH
jgi:dienelactone hydrolase